MRYERIREEGTAVFYEVFEHGKKAAEFSYAMESRGAGVHRDEFWIRRIHMEQDYLDYTYLDAVLQFLQYKCWCSNCMSMYVQVNAVNLMDIERYQRYGFYVMAEQVSDSAKGETVCNYVLKYPLPREWEEIMNTKERAFYYERKR
mgnify:FL=1